MALSINYSLMLYVCKKYLGEKLKPINYLWNTYLLEVYTCSFIGETALKALSLNDLVSSHCSLLLVISRTMKFILCLK